MNIIGRLLAWAYNIPEADLDKLAAARPRREKWSDFAKRMSGR
jgi:hypothetical protein